MLHVTDCQKTYQQVVGLDVRCLLLKGGNPAAPSGTATLLRLSPSQRSRFRRWPPLRVGIATLSAPSFHGLTGGVYKARERIHRGVLTHDY